MHGKTDEFKWPLTSPLLVLLLLATSPSTVSTKEDCPGNSDTPYVLVCKTTQENEFIPWDKWVDKCVIPKAVNRTIVDSYANGKFRVVNGLLQCKDGQMPFLWEADIFYISEHGWFGKEPKEHLYEPQTFCICQYVSNTWTAHFCAGSDESKGMSDALSNAVFLSLPFFILTILVYALIDELRDLHGKCLICHVFSLLVGYISVLVSQSKTHCYYSGYGMQFFFLASFSWLNVMCFDLLIFAKYGRNRAHESKRFIKYNMYAWGSSLFISVVTYCAQYLPEDNMFQPKFGHGHDKTGDKCGWFGTKLAEAIYYYGIVGVLLLINLLIMGYIMKNVLMFLPQTSNSQRSRQNKYRLKVCLELITVMGLNWLLDIVAWVLGSNDSVSHWFGEIVTYANAFLGLSIFVIYVCKDRVLSLISKCFEDRFYVSVNSTRRSNTRDQTEIFSLDRL